MRKYIYYLKALLNFLTYNKYVRVLYTGTVLLTIVLYLLFEVVLKSFIPPSTLHFITDTITYTWNVLIIYCVVTLVWDSNVKDDYIKELEDNDWLYDNSFHNEVSALLHEYWSYDTANMNSADRPNIEYKDLLQEDKDKYIKRAKKILALVEQQLEEEDV